jgi:hypothetical protein
MNNITEKTRNLTLLNRRNLNLFADWYFTFALLFNTNYVSAQLKIYVNTDLEGISGFSISRKHEKKVHLKTAGL